MSALAGLQWFSVVTLNTWKCDGGYSQRLRAMAGLLAQLGADVILLQEVLSVPDKRLNTAHYLAAELGYFCVYHPAREKIRSLEGRDGLCQSGMAVLGRTPITSSRAITLPTDAADGERIGQIATRAQLPYISFINLHLTHLAGRPDLRQQQMARLISAAGHDPNRAIVAAGDFNDWVDADWLKPVIAETGQSIKAFRRNPQPSLVAEHGAPTANICRHRCIDHVLAVGKPTLHGGDITHHGDIRVSDHLAVRIDIGWDSPA